MKISKIQFYGGSMEKVCRLGLAQLFLELQEILLATEVLVLNKKQANGAGRVREMIDEQFGNYSDWVQSKTGDVDWVKRLRYNQTILSRMGVEIQVSGRSDLLARDIVHIRNNLQDSHIDVGVIVVPSDDFAYLLTDRVASFSYAVQYVEHELREAQSYPIAPLWPVDPDPANPIAIWDSDAPDWAEYRNDRDAARQHRIIQQTA